MVEGSENLGTLAPGPILLITRVYMCVVKSLKAWGTLTVERSARRGAIRAQIMVKTICVDETTQVTEALGNP